MKAIVYEKFGPPEVLQLHEVDKPTPGDNQVLVRIHATTVVKEDPDWRASPGFNGLSHPRHPILGQELAGEVEAVGKDVTRFQPGDDVYGMVMFGAYAQYICMSQDEALVHMPANMSYQEAVTVPNGALTALHFLRDKGSIREGQSVLVYGASGSVGSAAVQLARYFGAKVTAVCSTGNLEWVKALGADFVIDYTREDFTTNGKTYDIIYDSVGKRSYGECKMSLTETGVFLTTVPTPAVMLREFLLSKRRGKRARFGAAGIRSADKKIADLEFLTGIIEEWEYTAVIDRTYQLDEMAEAHRYVEEGHKKGNVVVIVEHEG